MLWENGTSGSTKRNTLPSIEDSIHITVCNSDESLFNLANSQTESEAKSEHYVISKVLYNEFILKLIFGIILHLAVVCDIQGN